MGRLGKNGEICWGVLASRKRNGNFAEPDEDLPLLSPFESIVPSTGSFRMFSYVGVGASYRNNKVECFPGSTNQHSDIVPFVALGSFRKKNAAS